MFRFLFIVAAIAVGVWILQQSLPDLERYMKLRAM